jgi:mannose-6-phosphate isomerase-like protein (cupin superfamily)
MRMDGYCVDLVAQSRANSDFRRVLYTAPHLQLVVMTLQGGEAIGLETHPTIDQVIRVEAGAGEAVVGGARHALAAGSAVVVPAGVAHNISNTSATEPLRLSTLYAPPNHPAGTIHHAKQDAMAAEHAEPA